MPTGLALLATAILAAGAAPRTSDVPAPGGPVAPRADSARFEGVIDMRLTLEGASGDMTLSLSRAAARLDLKVVSSAFPVPVSFSILHRTAVPGRVTLLDERARTFSELDLAEAAGLAAADGKSAYAVKVLGKGRVLGHPCTHLTLSREGEFIDAWVAEGLADAFAVLKTLQAANPQVGEGQLFRALEASGHAGLPMRCTVIREGQKVTTEVSRVARGPVPAARFAVPKGWKRTGRSPSARTGSSADAGRER